LPQRFEGRPYASAAFWLAERLAATALNAAADSIAPSPQAEEISALRSEIAAAQEEREKEAALLAQQLEAAREQQRAAEGRAAGQTEEIRALKVRPGPAGAGSGGRGGLPSLGALALLPAPAV
jgi:hypothetical protein